MVHYHYHHYCHYQNNPDADKENIQKKCVNKLDEIKNWKLRINYEYDIVEKYYTTVKPDGLCWLRTHFHAKYNYDPDISLSNQRDLFVEYIEKE